MIDEETIRSVLDAANRLSEDERAEVLYSALEGAVASMVLSTCCAYLKPECFLCLMRRVWIDGFSDDFMEKNEKLLDKLADDGDTKQLIRQAVVWAKERTEELLVKETCSLDKLGMGVPDEIRNHAAVALLNASSPAPWNTAKRERGVE